MENNIEDTITLTSPMFGKERLLKLGFSRELLFYGPIQLVYEGKYFGAFLHLVFTIFSFGYYWWWYAKNSQNSLVISLLNQSWEPKEENDHKTLMYNGIIKDKNSSSYIQTSRLGSVDHKL